MGWGPFLERWNAEWAAAPRTREEAEEDGEEGRLEEMVEAGLGFPPADEERITALERRLGATLPPSYRSFLAVSDGWRRAGSGVYLLGTSEGVHWHGDPFGFQEAYEKSLTSHSSAEAVLVAGMWSRALQLAVDSDMTDVLLDPGDVNAEGEWALYIYRGYSGEYPNRYESFGAFMREKYVEFHGDNGSDPGFVNDTTRALDASLERARLACLSGEDVDRQMETLAEAMRHARPRARKLYVQLTSMLGRNEYYRAEGRLEDPLVGQEFMPLAALEDARGGKDGDWFLRTLDEGDRAGGAALLERIRERGYVYESPGLFGEAVVAAREQARWGDTGGAWRTVEAALPDWEPYEDDHIAPIGLLADPILGPVVTPERGRRILSTPRGAGRSTGGDAGRPGRAGPSGPVKEKAPDGLAWLADPARQRHSYRFVLAEGIPPRELGERLGGEVLLPPHNQAETHPWRGIARDAPERVGLCGAKDGAESGPGWSFAFRDGTETFQPKRASPMGEKASRGGGRSVLVWCEIQGERSKTVPDTFHFSYSEDGRERYGFTARGGVTERRGEIPETLDPRLFFPEGTEGEHVGADESADEGEDRRVGERRMLTAVASAFGVSLPRFAIQHGRLHAVRTGPWTRPPGPGEQRLVFVRHRTPAPREEQ
ncbi:cell wall assembly protein [Streptomyces camponoticapitis]|uniref:Cell wall assembly protein n=1 Tax=Streptomyces camponoticapitis TaxID=1616125 RepID=A0ABQ2E8G4_9ACTN|nr:cell wall assembly protein [Streptomyces camponoticapitis]